MKSEAVLLIEVEHPVYHDTISLIAYPHQVIWRRGRQVRKAAVQNADQACRIVQFEEERITSQFQYRTIQKCYLT